MVVAVCDFHRAQLVEPFRACRTFTMCSSWISAEHQFAADRPRRRTAASRIRYAMRVDDGGVPSVGTDSASSHRAQLRDGVGGGCRCGGRRNRGALMGGSRTVKGTALALGGLSLLCRPVHAAPQPASTMERPFGVLVRSWTSPRTATRLWRATGINDRLPIPIMMVQVSRPAASEHSPAASTARTNMASAFHCTMRSMQAMQIAESERRWWIGIRPHKRRDDHDRPPARPGIDREGLQRHDRDEERDRRAQQQDVERDLVRRLAPHSALDEGDHAVEERLARLRGHEHHDLVRGRAYRRSRPSGRRPTRGSRGRTRL